MGDQRLDAHHRAALRCTTQILAPIIHRDPVGSHATVSPEKPRPPAPAPAAPVQSPPPAHAHFTRGEHRANAPAHPRPVTASACFRSPRSTPLPPRSPLKHQRPQPGLPRVPPPVAPRDPTTLTLIERPPCLPLGTPSPTPCTRRTFPSQRPRQKHQPPELRPITTVKNGRRGQELTVNNGTTATALPDPRLPLTECNHGDTSRLSSCLPAPRPRDQRLTLHEHVGVLACGHSGLMWAKRTREDIAD